MKRFGIIGGIGPESTIDYYRGIITRFRKINQNGDYPSIFINSINMTRMVELIQKNNLKSLVDELCTEIDLLVHAGAASAAIASNTPHMVFDELQQRSSIPLISILETAKLHATENGYKRCLLIGTGFTMKSSFYQNAFRQRDIEVIVPEEKDIDFIHDHIFNELELGIVNPETKKQFSIIIDSLNKTHHFDSVILGCTELPLMYRNETAIEGIPVLDTMSIHLDAIADFICS
jgi:aspartate racemase